MKFPREGAGLLSSLVDTDGVVELNEDVTRVEPGQMVGFLTYASLLYDEPETGRSRREHGPKGRSLDDAALAEVRALLGDRERRRDLLIEHLHLIQDRFGCLEARHLRALAEEMRLSQAEVYEVASFYDHFDVVREGEPKPARLTIRVCESISCMIAGADELIEELEPGVDAREVRVVRAACVGRCAAAPAARVGDREVDNATVEGLLGLAARTAAPTWSSPSTCALDEYRADGGYELLAKVRSGELGAQVIIEKLQASGLRGLGGAGFPPGKKWEFVRSYRGPRLMTINGDEGEPGTFKDRWFLERDPHRTLEGALIAAHAVEAQRIYFYMRNEYPGVLEILRREIAALEAAGIAPPGFVELRRGAGAYICGEESAMIESIEGKRGLPRNRPPYIAEVGVFGRPTLNQNVETLWWIRDILQKGAGVVREAKDARAIRDRGRGPCRAASKSPASSARRPASPCASSSTTTAAACSTATFSRPTCRAAPRAGFCPHRWATFRSISAASSRSSARSSARTRSSSSRTTTTSRTP